MVWVVIELVWFIVMVGLLLSTVVLGCRFSSVVVGEHVVSVFVVRVSISVGCLVVWWMVRMWFMIVFLSWWLCGDV